MGRLTIAILAAALFSSTALAQSKGHACRPGAPCAMSRLTVNGIDTPYQAIARAGRCTAWGAPANNAATAMTFTWLAASSAQGTASSQPAIAGSTRYYIQWASGTVIGNVGGLQGSAHLTPRFNSGIIWSIGIRQDTILTRRDYFGMTGSIIADAAPVVGPAALAQHRALIAFDPAISANYLCCTADGANGSCTAIPDATVEAATEYNLTVDYMAADAVVCSVKKLSTGATWSTRKTTNLPSRVVGTAPATYSEAKVFTQAAAARNVQASWVFTEWGC